MPEFLTGYGWSLRPHTLHAWYRALATLEVPSQIPLVSKAIVVSIFSLMVVV